MTRQEAEALTGEIRAEIARTPVVSDVQVEDVPGAGNVPPMCRVRVLITYPGNLSRFVSSRAAWDELKAELLNRWPPARHRPSSAAFS